MLKKANGEIVEDFVYIRVLIAEAIIVETRDNAQDD